MPRSRSFAEVRAELADEHRQVMNLIARIEAPCADDELPDALKALHDLLVNHFAHEQFPGGLYERMGAHHPEHHETLKILVREHCEILSAARALVERAQRRAAEGDLREETRQVLDSLRRHETREHELARSVAATGPQPA